jgi:hypothetical protein
MRTPSAKPIRQPPFNLHRSQIAAVDSIKDRDSPQVLCGDNHAMPFELLSKMLRYFLTLYLVIISQSFSSISVGMSFPRKYGFS